MASLGRMLITIGIIAIVLGVLLLYSDLFSSLRLGRLPGDISIKRGSFSFYFPITTCILLSVLISLILYLLRR